MRNGAVELLERFTAAMNRHDAVGAVELLSDEILFWEPTYPEPRRGRDAIRRDLEGFFAMLPDVRFTTETLIAEGDRAVHEWSYRASYDGRAVELRECAVARLDEAGRPAEIRVYFDRLTLLRQLGLAPEA